MHLHTSVPHTNMTFPPFLEVQHLPAGAPQAGMSVLHGDPNGREQGQRDDLVLRNLATVRHVARRVHERLPRHVELDELESAGLLGLIDAASKFDLTRAVQFRSYAQFRVKGAILDFLRALDWSPRDLRHQAREIQKTIHVLSGRLGRAPSEVEVAEAMHLSTHELQQLNDKVKGTEILSLDAEQEDYENGNVVDFVPADASSCPLRQCIEREAREQLAAAIDTLPERERLVLTLSYFEELTLSEIGSLLGVVESRVFQIRASAVARLKRTMKRSPATHNPVPSFKVR